MELLKTITPNVTEIDEIEVDMKNGVSASEYGEITEQLIQEYEKKMKKEIRKHFSGKINSINLCFFY